MINCSRRNYCNMKLSVAILGCTIFIVLLAYFAFGDSNSNPNPNNLSTLRFVAMIFRHGDRAPTEIYKNDPHAEYNWPGGLGALSKKGSLQLLKQGQILRTRYAQLLPSNGWYTRDNLYVLSSIAERCLMSAASFMAGFLPPNIDETLLPITWQPVPIYSLPRDQDHILVQRKPCPKYDKLLETLYDKQLTSPEMQALNEEHAGLYQYLTQHTGQNVSNILEVEFLYNILDIEQNNGLKLPDWTNGVFPDRMLPLAKRNLALLTETPYMKKIKGGAFVTEIIEIMTKKRDQTLTPSRSIFIYSAHDVTLVNIMRALEIVEQTSQKPNYAATLAIELHENPALHNDWEVKIVYYANSETATPINVSISNCKYPCALEQFIKVNGHILINDYDEECKIN